MEQVKSKIKFISKLMKMQKVLRQENENIVKLKGACPDSKIPKGLLTAGTEAVKDAVVIFQSAKNFDIVNEKIPDIVVPQLGNMQKKSVFNQKLKSS